MKRNHSKTFRVFLTLLFLGNLTSCFKKEAGNRLIIATDIEQKKIKINRIIGKKSNSLKVIKTNKIISEKPQLFPVDPKKFQSWLKELTEIEFEETGEIKEVKKRNPMMFVLNGDNFTIQVFAYRYKKNVRYIRLVRYEKKKKEQHTHYGTISLTDMKKLFSSFNRLRKDSYKISDNLVKGRYIIGKELYDMNPEQVAKVKEMINSFQANSYPYSGKVDQKARRALGIGVDSEDSLKGHFQFYGSKNFYVYIARTGNPKRARIWVRGDIEVLEGNFKNWDELMEIEAALISSPSE